MTLIEAINPALAALMPQIVQFIQDMNEDDKRLDRANVHFYDEVDNRALNEVIYRRENFYVLKLLSKQGADYFLQLADSNAGLFTANQEEGEAYQIPEIVLLHYPNLMESWRLCEEIASQVLWPIFSLMYGNTPNECSSIQLARYSHPDNAGTGWHSDDDSEASCVVSLSPERHVGGGTMLMPYGVFGDAHFLPSLPKGSALLFNGRTTLHRGMELASGQRNLLVYWMKNNN